MKGSHLTRQQNELEAKRKISRKGAGCESFSAIINQIVGIFKIYYSDENTYRVVSRVKINTKFCSKHEWFLSLNIKTAN